MIDNKFFTFLKSFNDYVAQFSSNNVCRGQFDQIASAIMEILAINKFATMSRDIFDELLNGTLFSDYECEDTDEDKRLEFVLNLTSVNIYSSEASLYTLECEDMDRVYDVVYNAQDTRFKGIFPFFDVEFIYSQDKLLGEFLKHKILTASKASINMSNIKVNRHTVRYFHEHGK